MSTLNQGDIVEGITKDGHRVVGIVDVSFSDVTFVAASHKTYPCDRAEKIEDSDSRFQDINFLKQINNAKVRYHGQNYICEEILPLSDGLLQITASCSFGEGRRLFTVILPDTKLRGLSRQAPSSLRTGGVLEGGGHHYMTIHFSPGQIKLLFQDD